MPSRFILLDVSNEWQLFTPAPSFGICALVGASGTNMLVHIICVCWWCQIKSCILIRFLWCVCLVIVPHNWTLNMEMSTPSMATPRTWWVLLLNIVSFQKMCLCACITIAASPLVAPMVLNYSAYANRRTLIGEQIGCASLQRKHLKLHLVVNPIHFGRTYAINKQVHICSFCWLTTIVA